MCNARSGFTANRLHSRILCVVFFIKVSISSVLRCNLYICFCFKFSTLTNIPSLIFSCRASLIKLFVVEPSAERDY